MPNPLTPHPSWGKHHATKLMEYCRCARKEFYTTILGWKKEKLRNDAHFGSSWHRGLEKGLLKDGYTTEGIVAACEAFVQKYREKFGPETDENFPAKNPTRATQAYLQYALNYRAADEGEKVLHTEAYGAVPINGHGRLIHFKMDSVIQRKRIRVREFKTGSGVRSQWLDKWMLDFQVGTYNHVLHCLYPEPDIFGVEIDGTHFLKTETKFVRVPCVWNYEMLDAWLSDINWWANDFEENIEKLMDEDDSQPTMRSFPRNPTSCMDFFGCEYHPFCTSWGNPLRHLDVIPIGFYQEYWDPSDEEQEGEALEVAPR